MIKSPLPSGYLHSIQNCALINQAKSDHLELKENYNSRAFPGTKTNLRNHSDNVTNHTLIKVTKLIFWFYKMILWTLVNEKMNQLSLIWRF